jgi:FtsP/CotA-like multicopper oxidase with cupredoxin domain
MSLSRRSLIAGTALATCAPSLARAAGEQKILRLQTRQIEVAGKAATRYGVTQASGAFGLTLSEGEDLDVRLENKLTEPSGLHWHGLIPPWQQDGVPYISGPPVPPGKSADFKFPARPTGTRWMHSHFGLQEQSLLAAPLIVRETAAIKSGVQEVVILLQDFSWTNPQELFAGLRKAKPEMNMAGGGINMSGGMKMGMSKADLNDVTYDAFLANDRTLADPQVIDVGKDADVRLRIINASSSTNFWIDLGAVTGTLLAVDGNPTSPLQASRFPLAVAQRVDIEVRAPAGRSLPVLARGEGRTLQTGVILRPPGAAVIRVVGEGTGPAPAVRLEQEMQLRAAEPLLVRAVDRSVPVNLTGTMAGYVWGMQVHGLGGAPVTVKRGERVELVMRNTTMMTHPMHLHGHNFQVTEINGQKLSGAVRDSVAVPPMTTVKVVFDADNPGLWAYHCHNLYHMEAGMFSTVVYEGFS